MSVRIVSYQGFCDLCETPAPEVRDSAEEAQQDVNDCPRREESSDDD